MADTIGHAHALAQALKRDNRTFVENKFEVASYENIDVHFHRHHEVIFSEI